MMVKSARNDLTIYDEVAAQWWSDEVRWVRTLKNLVPGRLAYFDRHFDWAGKAVLDVGCAGGFMAEALTERGACVRGIDPAKAAIRAATLRAEKMGQEIEYTVGVGEQLPYGDSVFDAVVCVDVLEHVADLGQVMAETARVLKPGGCYLFDTINRNPLAQFATITVAEDILRLLPKGTHDPALFIKPAELEAALVKAGFERLAFTGLGPRGLTGRLDLTFGPFFLQTIQYMGVAYKA